MKKIYMNQAEQRRETFYSSLKEAREKLRELETNRKSVYRVHDDYYRNKFLGYAVLDTWYYG